MSVPLLEDNLSLDQTTKYQTVAREYAKVRSQVAVLKNAIREEQLRSSAMKNEIIAKEQELRKNRQEIDGLGFRNTQLTKRITVLQEELERFQSMKKRTLHHTDDTDIDNIFQEELQNRILQNAKLLSELEERDMQLELLRINSATAIETLEKALKDIQNKKPARTCECDILCKRVDSLECTDQPIQIGASINSPACSQLQDLNKTIFSQIIGEIMIIANCLGNDWETMALGSLAKAFILPEENRFSNFVSHLFQNMSHAQCSDPSKMPINNLLRKILNEIIKHVSVDKDLLTKALADIEEITRSLRMEVTTILDGDVSFDAVGMIKSLNRVQDLCTNLHTARVENQHGQIKCVVPECQFNFESSENSTVRLIDKTEDMIVQSSTVCPNALKNILLKKENNLREDLQFAESKLTRVSNELNSVRARLQFAMEEASSNKQSVSSLQEELLVTAKNYDDQLGSMSEHMANMNEKIAAQQTMIEELTLQLNLKESKKVRGK